MQKKTDTDFDIHQHAMLLSMRISCWSGHKTAQKISEETAATNDAEKDVVGAFKRLLPKDALKPHHALRARAATCFYKWSLPWANDGQRIILNTALDNFEKDMRGIKADWDEATKEFVAKYPDYLAAAPKRLGKLFDLSEFPEPSTVAERFALTTSILPLPAASDFRVNLSDRHLDRVRREITEQVATSLQDAMKDVWRRMFLVVEKMQKKLVAYTITDDGVENAFRASLVDNISELLDMIPALNVTQDPSINQFAKRMRSELTQYTAETLRENDGLRAEVAGKAQVILDKMRDFL